MWRFLQILHSVVFTMRILMVENVMQEKLLPFSSCRENGPASYDCIPSIFSEIPSATDLGEIAERYVVTKKLRGVARETDFCMTNGAFQIIYIPKSSLECWRIVLSNRTSDLKRLSKNRRHSESGKESDSLISGYLIIRARFPWGLDLEPPEQHWDWPDRVAWRRF